MRTFVRQLNGLFINLFLFVLYFVTVGFSFMLWKVSGLFVYKSHRASFWQDPETSESSNFDSPY